MRKCHFHRNKTTKKKYFFIFTKYVQCMCAGTVTESSDKKIAEILIDWYFLAFIVPLYL